MTSIGSDITADLDAGCDREWLQTNGLGGWSSSTANGAHTRRYHGLLVAAMKPPADRCVLLFHVDETVRTGSAGFDFGCNAFPPAVHPQGFRRIERFELDPFPVYTCSLGVAELLRAAAEDLEMI